MFFERFPVAGHCKVFGEVNENKWSHGRKT